MSRDFKAITRDFKDIIRYSETRMIFRTIMDYVMGYSELSEGNPLSYNERMERRDHVLDTVKEYLQNHSSKSNKKYTSRDMMDDFLGVYKEYKDKVDEFLDAYQGLGSRNKDIYLAEESCMKEYLDTLEQGHLVLDKMINRINSPMIYG